MADRTSTDTQLKAPDMADLLEYFEARSRVLDEEGQPVLDASTLQFMSLIKFNGVSILPPVLTQGRREEMMSYKHEAVRREKTTRAKKKEELQAKVQSIVAGVEERRAAKQAARAMKSTKSPSPSSRKPSDKHNSEMVSKVTSKATSQASAKVPSEIVINLTDTRKETTSVQSKSSKSSAKSSSSTGKHSMSPSRSASQGGNDARKKESTNYKSLGKLGTLSKQKSYSSQNLARSETQTGKYDSDTSTSSAKNLSLSPNSRGLLPHPPVGRPPSRGSSMRQSASTPDLRNIDVSVLTEDLRKPLPSGRSLSPKGGRPQAPDRDNCVKLAEKPEKETKSMKLKESPKQVKSSESKVKSETASKKRVSDQKTNQRENSGKRIGESSSKKTVQTTDKDKHVKSGVKTADQHGYPLQNPLEILEQELSKEEEYEMNKRFSKPTVQNMEPEVRQELDPIQTATAELFPFPISEEQALATLDSLQTDFASLEQFDSLPRDYNGIPLTSLKQQQIIHMLTKLSKALNMEDTMTSTISSNVVGDSLKQGGRMDSSGDNRSVPNGASGRSYYSGQSDLSEIVDDMSANVTNDSTATNSSFQNSSAHSRARMSPTGSSILSSASSVSASRSRMSPKSLKNTVHFSTLVTEISTSASQSYEDKISYRKLDITPKNSENFEDSIDGNRDSKNLQSEGQGVRPGPSLSMPTTGSKMLSKVALSPSVDSSAGSPGEFQNHNPFVNTSQDSELNTSDKENEFMPAEQESSDENYTGETNVRTGRNPHVLNVYTAHIPAGPIGENHPAVLKPSVKADTSNGSSVKDGQEKVLQENFSKTNMNVDSQYYHSSNLSDLDRYIQGKVTSDDSISSMQEEITRSYLLSQSKPEKEFYQVDENFELKKAKKVSRKKPDLEDSAIFLQPIVFSNTGNSLKENRSMLDEEDMIRSNLQRVQLDSESESDTEQVSDQENLGDEIQVVEHELEYEELEVVQDIPVRDFEHEGQAYVKLDQPSEYQSEDVVEEIDNPDESYEIDGSDQNNETDKTEETNENDESETDEDSDESGDSENDQSEDIKSYENKDEECIEVREENEKQLMLHENIEEIHTDVKNDISVTEDVEMPNAIQENIEQPVSIQENTEQPIEIQESAKQPIRIQENIKQLIRSQDYDKEEEAKAEHIQKYLNQVHEHSLNQEVDIEDDAKPPENNSENFTEVMDSIGALIQSFTSSIHNMNHLSQEELFRLQSEQFETIQQRLIEHQRAQLEELFVTQRKEQMNLEMEIEVYQKNINTDNIPAQDPLKPQMSNSMPQVTQAWQSHPHHPVHSSAKSPPFSVQPVAYPGSYPNPNMSFNTSYSTIAPYQDPGHTVPFQNPRMCMVPNVDPRSMVPNMDPRGMVPNMDPRVVPNMDPRGMVPNMDPRVVPNMDPRGMVPNMDPRDMVPNMDPRGMVPHIDPRAGVAMNVPMGFMPDPNISTVSHNTSYSTIPHHDPGMLRGNQAQPHPLGVIHSQDPGSSQASNPFIYPSSPSLYMNPKDRDNVSEVSGFAKATPKQLVFSNQSTPVPVAKTYKPIQHSPVKQVSSWAQDAGRYVIPDKVFDPQMQPKFERVSAVVKGYLTRRLLKTPKVQEIIQKLSDTRNFAFSFQAETPIKKGTYSREDRVLLERIVNQLQGSLLDIHEIFFIIPVSERMAIIAAARQLEQERTLRESQRRSMESVSRSQPRLSKATLKAMERKKKAQLAEEAVFGSTEFRPKSAPPATSSPHLSTDIRALRPLQGQMSPITADGHVTVREIKERPRTAPEKKKTSDTHNKTKKTSGTKSGKSSSNSTSNKQQRTTVSTSTKTKKMEKAWR